MNHTRPQLERWNKSTRGLKLVMISNVNDFKSNNKFRSKTSSSKGPKETFTSFLDTPSSQQTSYSTFKMATGNGGKKTVFSSSKFCFSNDKIQFCFYIKSNK